MVADVVTVTVDVLGPPLRSSVPKLSLVVSPASTLVAARVTVPANPFNGVTVTVDVPLVLGVSVNKDGYAETSRPAVEAQVPGT
jgi:hypothetical protein